MAPGQKKAQQEGRTIVFVDESEFYMLPVVARIFAPQGQTSVLRERLTHDHLSAISGVTPDGKLHMQVQTTPFRSPQVVGFLRQRHLHRHIRGKVLSASGGWDRAPIHPSNVIKEYLATPTRRGRACCRRPGLSTV